MVPQPVTQALAVFHHHLGRSLVSIILLALASAAFYGVAAVLQHEAAIQEPSNLSMRAGLLVRLAARPRWLLGTGFDCIAYVFQFLALRRGSLALVEPILVLSLVFALPIAARLNHQRVSRAELSSTGAIAAGLALFLGVAHPGLGHPRASITAWMILTAVVVVGCGALVLASRGASARRAAVLLAVGSGSAFGYVAALTERTGHLINNGVLHTLSTWEPYALAAGAAGALLLTQSAFHAGALRLSLPTLTVAQPLVAGCIGVGLFGEHIHSHGAAPVFEALGLLLIVIGVFVLARSSPLATDPETLA